MSKMLSELLRLIAHERKCQLAHASAGNDAGVVHTERCIARYEMLAAREGWCAEPERLAA